MVEFLQVSEIAADSETATQLTFNHYSVYLQQLYTFCYIIVFRYIIQSSVLPGIPSITLQSPTKTLIQLQSYPKSVRLMRLF